MAESSFIVRNRKVITAVISAAAFVAIVAITNAQPQRIPRRSLHRSNAVRRPRNSGLEYNILEVSEHYPLGRIEIISRWDRCIYDIGREDLLTAVELRRTLQLSPEGGVEANAHLLRLVIHQMFICDLQLLDTEEEHWSPVLNFVNAANAAGLDDPAQLILDHAEPLADFIGNVTPQLVEEAILNQCEEGGPPALVSGSSGSKTADELKGILYYIAEEQARRKAYQHRGISCEECGESPIRNIRWRCLNCADFDLCSTCKALTSHPKSHIFAEIKIPIPQLSQPVDILPSWYPGDDSVSDTRLTPVDRRILAHQYELDEPDIDALADQFSCLANIEYAEEEIYYLGIAINKEAFTRAFRSRKWYHQCSENLVISQMFKFYDADQKGVIDFEHFVSGVAYIRGRHRFEPLTRAIQGFDIRGRRSGSGISRGDFLALLKAKYDVHRVMIEEINENEELARTKSLVSILEEHTIPLSTIFRDEIHGGAQREVTGKSEDRFGDMQAEEYMHPAKAKQADMQPVDRENLEDYERRVLGLGPTTVMEEAEEGRSADHMLLWNIVEQSLTEILDILYKPAEEIMKQIKANEQEFERWKPEIEALIQKEQSVQQDLKENADLDPLIAIARHSHTDLKLKLDQAGQVNIQQALLSSMMPIDEDSLAELEKSIAEESLETQLDRTGYSVVVDDDRGDEHEAVDTADLNKGNAELPNTETIPSTSRLRYLAALFKLTESLREYPTCGVTITPEKIAEIVKYEKSKRLEGLIKSWLLWAAF